ncbi:MAG: hypothetical protein AB7U46_15670 [Paenirhodobacter sp.]|uniref:hypothetical protein n=1 Tax=Paenirhodobacter sp. TaxID=1965326 RepID=UPI003D0DFA7D
MLTLETCLRLWPTILMRAPVGTEDHEFAMKIEVQALRPGWEPGPIALGYMRALCAKYAADGKRLDPDFCGDAL